MRGELATSAGGRRRRSARTVAGRGFSLTRRALGSVSVLTGQRSTPHNAATAAVGELDARPVASAVRAATRTRRTGRRCTTRGFFQRDRTQPLGAGWGDAHCGRERTQRTQVLGTLVGSNRPPHVLRPPTSFSPPNPCGAALLRRTVVAFPPKRDSGARPRPAEPKGDVPFGPRERRGSDQGVAGAVKVRAGSNAHTYSARRVRIEDAQAASRPVVGVSREATARTGVAVILIERAASCSASSWKVLQRSPYWSRSRGGSRPAVESRCAGTNTRKGVGRRASRITAATSFAGAVTAIVSPLIWAAKYSRKSASERGITEAGVPKRRATSAISW